MLAADKLLLQSNLRQNAIKLKEKEFTLHHDNFQAVGTQAAVLAGFAVTALIEFQMPAGVNRALQFAYYLCVVGSLGANLTCVSSTTALSVCGTGLALRGPDGAMIRAVDGMYEERRQVFITFGCGLYMMLAAGMLASWIIMMPEAAVCSTICLLVVMKRIYLHAGRIYTKFRFSEDEAETFDDILNTSLVTNAAGLAGSRRPRNRDQSAEHEQILPRGHANEYV